MVQAAPDTPSGALLGSVERIKRRGISKVEIKDSCDDGKDDDGDEKDD